MNEFDRQLELKLAAAENENSFRNARKTRPAGANWWFTQMRQVVNGAFDWSPAPAARPVQTYLEGGFIRGIDLAPMRKKY